MCVRVCECVCVRVHVQVCAYAVSCVCRIIMYVRRCVHLMQIVLTKL